MTSPTPPTGAANAGSTTGSLGSGATGTLGTNILQQDISTLSDRIQDLTTAVGNLVQNIQTSGSSSLGSGGNATRQQGPANSNGGFPAMVNSSRMGAQTSGGNGGWGNNTSGMSSGGYKSNRSQYGANGGVSGVTAAVGAVAGYGVAQSQNLVSLNSYATASLTGYNYNGMSQNQAMQQLYAQAGATPGSQISIGTGTLQDNLQYASTLQQAAGASNYASTARGRTAAAAANSFGITNPNLTAASAASMGAGLLSPMLSMNMLKLGYGQSILSRTPGGVNLNAGQSNMAILQGMGLGKATSSQVKAAFASGGIGQSNLNYLLQGTGISSSAMQSSLTDYAQLVNNKGMTSTAAMNLMNAAATGSPASMKAARATLSKDNIKTANNDLASLTLNSAAQTGRAGDVAGGFNQGLQDSAGLLTKFNNALNEILKGPLGTALGFGGGSLGTIAGSALGSGTNMLGTISAYKIATKVLGKKTGPAVTKSVGKHALPSAGEDAADAAATGGGATVAGAAGLLALLAEAAKTRYSAGGVKGLLAGDNLNKDPAYTGRFGPATGIGNPASIGGGATSVSSSTTQSRTGGNSQSASVSSAAKKAVSAAESQRGVPYAYGAETPGVGFDCSALIQWAYKQAGVGLPRTSESQWTALSKRSVPLNKVQEGDIVFGAGSDGSANNPGHVGLMVNGHQVIQAAHRGTKIGISAYSAGDWSHAARPSGSGSFIAGSNASAVSGSTADTAASNGTAGNTGAATGLGGHGSSGAYGSVNEADVVNAMGGSGGQGGYSSPIGIGTSNNTNGSSGAANTNTKTSVAKSGSQPSSGSAKSIAQQIAKKFGWGSGGQWQAILNIVGAEDASWSLTAKNPGSDAYGIAQFINGPGEYKDFGGNSTTVAGQVTAMLNYIKERPQYGNPEKAWAFHKKNGWYAAGGTTLPGLAVVGERGPELMMQGGGNQVFSNAQTMQLINSIRGSSPAQSPWKTDITSGNHTGGAMSTPSVNVNFSNGSIVVNASGNSTQTATQSAQEIQRQIVKQLSTASMHQAIKSGDKL